MRRAKAAWVVSRWPDYNILLPQSGTRVMPRDPAGHRSITRATSKCDVIRYCGRGRRHYKSNQSLRAMHNQVANRCRAIKCAGFRKELKNNTVLFPLANNYCCCSKTCSETDRSCIIIAIPLLLQRPTEAETNKSLLNFSP